MTYLPILPVTRPRDLAGTTNGALPSGLLRSVGPKGELHHLAARSFEALRSAAATQGFHLTYTYGGTFRSYENQKALFLRRYTRDYEAGRNVTTSRRTWEGHRWYKRSGVAAAATPGRSNHGWGIAIDTALDLDLSDGIGPDDAVSIAPALTWLVANAWRYGFSWELRSEPWHIRYITGDAIPAATLDFERNGGTITPPDPSPTPSGRPTLKEGARGEWATTLQKLLRKVVPSAAAIAVDGHFGPQTARFVKAFQGPHAPPPDGIVGPKTWAALLRSEADLATARPVYPTVTVGSRGSHVSYLQRVLQKCQAHVIVDGIFGAQTEKAVKVFQAKCAEVTADGQVGPATWPKVMDVGDGFKVSRP